MFNILSICCPTEYLAFDKNIRKVWIKANCPVNIGQNAFFSKVKLISRYFVENVDHLDLHFLFLHYLISWYLSTFLSFLHTIDSVAFDPARKIYTTFLDCFPNFKWRNLYGIIHRSIARGEEQQVLTQYNCQSKRNFFMLIIEQEETSTRLNSSYFTDQLDGMVKTIQRHYNINMPCDPIVCVHSLRYISWLAISHLPWIL